MHEGRRWWPQRDSEDPRNDIALTKRRICLEKIIMNERKKPRCDVPEPLLMSGAIQSQAEPGNWTFVGAPSYSALDAK